MGAVLCQEEREDGIEGRHEHGDAGANHDLHRKLQVRSDTSKTSAQRGRGGGKFPNFADEQY